MQDEILKEFRLVGGTALSLCIGHRISIDIDLFTDQSFDATKLYNHLLSNYQAEKMRAVNNGVFGLVEDIKIDLISHQYPWLKQVNEIDKIRMASLEDIGAMKVHAIVQSGSRLKDFVDIYYLLEKLSINELINAYNQKYPEANRVLAQNSLIYFNDVDFDIPVKLMEDKLNWEVIEKRLKSAHNEKDLVFMPQQQIKRKRGRHM